MIEYYDLLNEEEQDDMRDLIQLLLRQTFLLERKYEIGRASCRERV